MPIIGQMDSTFESNIYRSLEHHIDIGNALLLFFCGLVILSFFVSFFCCAPRFGPAERDLEEQAPLLTSPPSP